MISRVLPKLYCRNDARKFVHDRNPFLAANEKSPLRQIRFEVKLGSGVHSLGCAFMGFKELEYVNLKDTSGITDMEGVFAGAKNFNQPLDWDTSRVETMTFMFPTEI